MTCFPSSCVLSSVLAFFRPMFIQLGNYQRAASTVRGPSSSPSHLYKGRRSYGQSGWARLVEYQDCSTDLRIFMSSRTASQDPSADGLVIQHGPTYLLRLGPSLNSNRRINHFARTRRLDSRTPIQAKRRPDPRTPSGSTQMPAHIRSPLE